MRIDIITVLPELLQSPLNYSILKRAQDKKLVEIVVHNLRDYSLDKHRRVDDYPFGGELAAAIMCDAIVRLIPGAIGDEQSALSDSFQDNLLAPPVYTRPAEYKGWRVPDVLLSGHQRKIDEWKHEQSLERTRRLRPDLLE